MKQKLKSLGWIILSVAAMLIIFIGLVGIGNYFQGIEQKMLGNLFMLSFPVATYFYVRFFNKKVNKLNARQYGFHFKSFFKNIVLGLGLALIILAIYFIIVEVFFGISVQFMGFKPNFETALLQLLITYALVGIWEEFFFRGLVFNTLVKGGFKFHTAAIISAILFSIIHFSSFDMTETSPLWYFGIVFIGYILVYIYTYTNSIWSVISFHFLWNCLATLMDDADNQIGILEVGNYAEHAIMLDNIMVVLLGIILALLLLSGKKITNSTSLKTYFAQAGSC